MVPLLNEICSIVEMKMNHSPSVQEQDASEEMARECLSSCVELAMIWNPKSDIVTYLWDYFHKRLVSSFLTTFLYSIDIDSPSIFFDVCY